MRDEAQFGVSRNLGGGELLFYSVCTSLTLSLSARLEVSGEADGPPVQEREWVAWEGGGVDYLVWRERDYGDKESWYFSNALRNRVSTSALF